MTIRPATYRVLLLMVLFLALGAFPSWAQKRALVQTKWSRSDGMRDGEDIYFLSSYSLYLPGRVIIPMFVVTDARYLYRDLSLYRISGDGDELERLWSLGPEASGKVVDLRDCRFARLEDKLYFSWRGGWDGEKKEIIYRLLEYDLASFETRFFQDGRILGDVSEALDYHPPDKIKRMTVWGRAGLQPLSEWELPSPLEYSSRDPRFLKKVILKQMVDREFRAAALAELDSRGNAKVLRQLLSDFEKDDDEARGTYRTKWEILLRMSATLRGDRPPDIFSAAFDNDVEALAGFLEAGADPNGCDDAGCTLLVYAVLGEAPDTMTLLFEEGADPRKRTKTGEVPWFYAALNPLRHRFLELSDK